MIEVEERDFEGLLPPDKLNLLFAMESNLIRAIDKSQVLKESGIPLDGLAYEDGRQKMAYCALGNLYMIHPYLKRLPTVIVCDDYNIDFGPEYKQNILDCFMNGEFDDD